MSEPSATYDYRRCLKSVTSYPFLHRWIPVDRFIIRPPASLVVRAVFKTSITPNQLTTCSFIFGLAAGLAYLGARPAYFILGGVLVMISTIFDCADGMLARGKGLTSRYGAFLDLFFDRISDFSVLTGATLGYYLYKRSLPFLIFGMVTVGLYFLQLSLYYLNELYIRSEKCGEGAEAKSLAVFLIFLFSLARRPDGILLGVFLMALPGTLIKLFRFLAKGREASAPAL